MSERIIDRNKSIIVACDIEIEELDNLVMATSVVEGIGGYKIGLVLALTKGLPAAAGVIRESSDLPIIYDHQKAGNDIPAMGSKFAKVCKDSGVDAVILFPFAGAKTERDWIHACQDAGLGVLVGAHMTHPEFLFEEGGSISEQALEEIYTIAANEGVTDFVVPGNKIEFVRSYKELFNILLGENNFTLYSPGFITQGGDISDLARIAGNNWHAIVGSAIYEAKDRSKATHNITRSVR